MRHLKGLSVVLAILVFAGTAAAWITREPPDYGGVTISNFSRRAGLAPVRFDHWLHRALYTCRLCHVDVGFAMEENGTKITAATNMKGFYCGACHNGTMLYGEKKIFSSCSPSVTPAESSRCVRCHSVGKSVEEDYDYDRFTAKLPKSKPGNLIDWEEAETRGLIHPVDYLPGISIRRKTLNAQNDFSITSKSAWMPDIIFSHKKHIVWNGCEVCHPDIFPSAKKGTVKYTMFEISAGQYCGLCHDRVAFTLSNCGKCHAAPVNGQ